MQCKVTNNSDMDLDELSHLIDDLASYIQNQMKFKSMPAITMQDDLDNADVLLGKTAQYDTQNKVITVYVSRRHPKDIMRSIAHELIHHAQNERGEFDNFPTTTTTGYAQQDPHLRKMEKEAYLKGNMCFRDWEDGYKKQMMESIHRQNSFKRRNTKMKIHKWKNDELNKLLMEKFNLGEGSYNRSEEDDKKKFDDGDDKDEKCDYVDCKDDNEEKEVRTHGGFPLEPGETPEEFQKKADKEAKEKKERRRKKGQRMARGFSENKTESFREEVRAMMEQIINNK